MCIDSEYLVTESLPNFVYIFEIEVQHSIFIKPQQYTSSQDEVEGLLYSVHSVRQARKMNRRRTDTYARFRWLFLSMVLAVGAGSAGPISAKAISSYQKPASSVTVIADARIYSAGSETFAQAMAFDGGEIIAVGSNAEVLKSAGPGARVIYAQQRLILPGFEDSHVHILEAMSPLAGTCIVGPRQRPNSLIQTLKQCAPTQPVLDWVLGWGWGIRAFLDAAENPLDAIDAAIPDRPAAIMEQTSHAVWVNTRALEVLGITRFTPDPPGGLIARDADGFPNGLLIDNAGDLAFEAALVRTPEIDEQQYQGLLSGLEQLARNGITSFADARVYWTRGYHELYARAEAEGKLTARAVLGLWAYPQKNDDEQLAILTKLYSNDAQQRVRRTQIKVYIDGITENTTARTLVPYLTDLGFGTPMGLNYFSEDRLTRYITELERVGYDFHIHAIGAGGVREALNAIERAREANPDIRDRRHRLTHVEHVHPDDLPRFAELNVTADIQLAGAFTDPARFEADNAPFIGADNPALPLPARALIDAGARLTLSSDFDVSPLNPFVGIAHAVTRSTGSLSVREAVDAYTINAAYSLRQEDRVGSLQVGKRADFVVLDRDIFKIPPNQIRQTEVLLTVFDGREVFRSPRFGCPSRTTRGSNAGKKGSSRLQQEQCGAKRKRARLD